MIFCDFEEFRRIFLVIVIKIYELYVIHNSITLFLQKLMLDRFIICKAVDVFIHKTGGTCSSRRLLVDSSV